MHKNEIEIKRIYIGRTIYGLIVGQWIRCLSTLKLNNKVSVGLLDSLCLYSSKRIVNSFHEFKEDIQVLHDKTLG